MTLSNQDSDTRQLQDTIEKLKDTSAIKDESIILADAGYGLWKIMKY